MTKSNSVTQSTAPTLQSEGGYKVDAIVTGVIGTLIGTEGHLDICKLNQFMNVSVVYYQQKVAQT